MTNENSDISPVAREIIELHEFFVDWFTGRCEKSEAYFTEHLVSHFASDFQMIPPSGDLLAGEALFSGLNEIYASNPDFGIQVRNIQERRISGTQLVIVTYEEWQKAALNSTPPNNVRISSGVLELGDAFPNGVRWLHLQETALPPERYADDPFDF